MSKSGESASFHLAPGVREMLVLGDEARTKSMQRDRWIDYARASAVLDRLSGARHHGRADGRRSATSDTGR